ncbi:cilia- and flagella-associated protein 52-like [Rhopilema esculentum]|uniref:cilia- and flagella-associated protein 52-like n=1 Tax=Rhopilema esculentum TaxID=499914 RepID=UPI0031D554D3|eukprot:gene9195-16869_t
MGSEDVEKLELESTIGFAGSVPGGLLVHPDANHLIYPLGNTVVIEDLMATKHDKSRQQFLSGHTNNVSCIAVSKSGRFVASGQVTHMGFKADVIVWDFPSKSLYKKLALHKVKVQALAFSPNDKFLVTLGGEDDGSVVVWDLKKKDAVCGSPAAVLSAGVTFCVAFANNSDNIFVSGGNKTLRVWEIDEGSRILRPTDCNMGQLKRIVKCIQVSDDDQFMYCGTTSGDILQINMRTKLLCHYGPPKDKFSKGVLSLALLKSGEILIGAGDGTVAIVRGENYKKVKSTDVEKGVTSLALRGPGHQFFAGTERSDIYKFSYAEFSKDLVTACHSGSVLDISFPYEYSDVFATCSKEDIRVWNAHTSKELLRIVVPNMTCHAVDFMRDGKTIISAWNDGKIRAYTPESGKLKYTIHDAHNKGVTAVATTSDCTRIISGGGEGQVRVWNVGLNGSSYKMAGAMKEHKGTVTCIKVKSNDKECVTSSTDGTCIIWDLDRFVRNQIIFANTMFKAVCYHPDECQIITVGTDRKIGYWETYDGTQIRELDGTKSGSINGLDVSPDQMYFVTGGEDKLLKVWKYNEGEVTHLGIGHSGDIMRVKICPQQKHVVSVSADGAVLRWKFPF